MAPIKFPLVAGKAFGSTCWPFPHTSVPAAERFVRTLKPEGGRGCLNEYSDFDEAHSRLNRSGATFQMTPMNSALGHKTTAEPEVEQYLPAAFPPVAEEQCPKEVMRPTLPVAPARLDVAGQTRGDRLLNKDPEGQGHALLASWRDQASQEPHR